MKVRELVRLLEKNGWRLVRTRGSHRQFIHPDRPGAVTVAGNLGRDIPPGTLHAILKATGLEEGHL
ncbi:MAG: addiction module toxin, HicA family [Armatimonadetes bacterium]|nr:addiction module toxin, HicA family [Armatimonadota bacterium]NIM24009.1 addiction module toxin, HicA family [Armatimonadota bacterium]NIM67859.1 addiction module toxin, HicA family [Armatimonadota bacterium]NIM76390.1 addiction module toxin, HicA family [Armatimonadota bacterium]NIN06089.1 addiction module toxin, HicA family [Armatimonadota bacterium]